MFFSRAKPRVQDLKNLQAARLPKAPPPRAAAPGSRSAKLVGDFLDTVTGFVNKEITDITQVPEGAYMSFEESNIPLIFKDSYAILTRGGSGIGIVASDAYAQITMFDLERRLKEKGLRITDWHRATREVVRVLHDNNQAAKEGAKVGKQTDIEVIAWDLIDQAVGLGSTSDIHIETRPGGFAQVFFRIFGERVEQPIIAATTAQEMCRCLYGVHADAATKETDWDPTKVQDTAIDRTTKSGTRVQLRFSSGPIHPKGNFHAVIRVLVMDAGSTKPLAEVGYTAEQVEAIEEMLVGAQGAVILGGPVNSGKSTSMQSMLTSIYENRGKNIKVITVEDPVEYVVKAACQMGVPRGRRSMEDKGTGSAYTTFLKGTLRQDADVVMVGEIRDAESATCVKDLVLTGRKLLTTLHVYEAMGVYARLREIGVPESVLLMPGFISGVIYQRLVPVLCPHCSITVQEAFDHGRVRPATWKRVMQVTDLEKHTVKCRGPGCPQCNNLGIVGRTPCAEILVPTPAFLAAMAAGDKEEARRIWLGNESLNCGGLGVTAIAHAITKMQRGEVDPVDIETQIGPIVAQHSEAQHSHGDLPRHAREVHCARNDLPPALR